MKSIYSILALLSIVLLSACSHSRHPDSLWYDPNDPGYEYAPAMYHSWPYEPLTQVTNEDATSWHYNSSPFNDYVEYDEEGNRVQNPKYKINSITPVAGTIARGKLDYYFDYENSDAGRAKAGDELVNPVVLDDYKLNEGRRLYGLYCDHCHGATGDGNGTIVEAGKFPTMGAYYDKLKDRRAGEIFHTITYGKGIMGSHASQLSPKQRWLIVSWVQTMQKSADAHKVRTMKEYHALDADAEAEMPEADAAPETDSTAVSDSLHMTAADTTEHTNE